MDGPEHEGVGDHNLAGHAVCVLLKHVEVGFGDCGRTWDTSVWWASKGNVEVLFITSDFIHGWLVTGVTDLEFFAATRQNDYDVAAIDLGNGAQIGFKRKECLLLVLLGSEHGIGLVVLHYTMTGVIDEVEGGLLAAPSIIDVLYDSFELSSKLL